MGSKRKIEEEGFRESEGSPEKRGKKSSKSIGKSEGVEWGGKNFLGKGGERSVRKEEDLRTQRGGEIRRRRKKERRRKGGGELKNKEFGCFFSFVPQTD